MTTKTVLLFVLLLPFFSLSAQKTGVNPAQNPPLAFESVSFSTEHGDIIISCENADQLTEFEITGEDANLDFGWKAGAPTNHFPMKLGVKPGNVTIKYTMKGEKTKIIRLKLVAREELKLAI